MTRHRGLHRLVAFGLVLLAAAVARAADPAGSVASLEGRAEAQHGGEATWAALAAGSDVFVGDHVRTADASRVKLLMRDDSVLTVGAKSEITIDELAARPGGPSTSRLGQLVGTLRAVVTERYGTRGSSFEVKTPTAVAGVRGTGFISLVDPDAKRTRVIGLYDITFVRSVTDTQGRHEVRIGPGQLTEILVGGQPSKPREVTKTELQSFTGLTEIKPGPPSGGEAGGPPSGPGSVPAEGSGDRGDPATPGPGGGRTIQRPDGVIDQPVDKFRGPQPPPPPPPR
ncbi:MAG TPA: FecR family protein [Candidatus Eisenbacteria bacterium]|nr:FecR family protein [Candidatus Eisenbacteria bacterium]